MPDNDDLINIKEDSNFLSSEELKEMENIIRKSVTERKQALETKTENDNNIAPEKKTPLQQDDDQSGTA